jgi:hypothetical protein
VTLTWDPPTISTNVAGYMLYYGTSSGTYTQSIDVGNVTNYTVGNLRDGLTYYFAATAYNLAKNQSQFSNEVSKTTPSQQYLLVVNKPGTGTGMVSGTGINCGDICLSFYNPGVTVTLSAKADVGSSFFGWSGGECNGTGLCTIAMNKATTITATFNINTSYFINASVSGTGGTISPSGSSSVNHGGSQTFTITPKTFYRIANVIVDGQSVGAVTNYTFNNVTANHTITAAFRYRWW